VSAADLAQAGFLAGGVARLGLAGIFAYSAWHALRNADLQAAAIGGYDLLPARFVRAAARAFPLLNLVAAVLLVAPRGAADGAILGAALLAVYAAAMAINVRRGRTRIDCGCGGAHGLAISAGLVGRNLVLACVLLMATALPASGTLNAASLACLGGGAACLLATYFTANQLLANDAALRAAGGRA
jgi:hypothetical protein